MAYKSEEELEQDRKTLLKFLKGWRDIPTIMQYMKVSRSTVDRRLNELFEEDKITWREKPDHSKRGIALEWRRA